jgi:hypothetical protein
MALGAAGLNWRLALALILLLMHSPCVVWALAGQGASGRADSVEHVDPSIRRAQSLLDTRIPVPIDVVDVRTLPPALGRLVKGTCAYVHHGVPRIYVTSSCPVYQAARDSLFDAMKLAGILRHELAHLEGADEARAYVLEARTVRQLVGRGPSHFVTRGLAYAGDLDRRAAASAKAAKRTGLNAAPSGPYGPPSHVIVSPPPPRQ